VISKTDGRLPVSDGNNTEKIFQINDYNGK